MRGNLIHKSPGFTGHRKLLPLVSVNKTPRLTPLLVKLPFRVLSVSAALAKMVKAVRIYELGGPEVMKWEDVEIEEPKEGEIRVKNKAIGVNFIDVYFRKGVYKTDLPFTPGREAVGVVTAVGPGLTGRQVGDVVAYAAIPMGSYAEEQILPASVAVPLPPSIECKVAASVILKGMTAHMLLRRCFKVEQGHTILVHAAAGGVGSLLCQWANALGATVIGTVSNEEKAAQAKEDGCHHVIIYTKDDFVTVVNNITSGKGVNAVYDSVGKDTFQLQSASVIFPLAICARLSTEDSASDASSSFEDSNDNSGVDIAEGDETNVSGENDTASPRRPFMHKARVTGDDEDDDVFEEAM